MKTITDIAIERAAHALAEADALLITAGAGMGVDSGLPDYRSEGGFYNAYPLFERLGLTYQKITTPKVFRTEPTLAWGFWGHLLSLYRNTVPHTGFHILHAIAQRMPHGYFVLTTNIDGQFQKAGFPEENVREGHGSVHMLQCQEPCVRQTWPASSVSIEVDLDTMRAASALPTCPYCGGLARPNVFMFGDTSYVWEESNGSADRLWAWLSGIRQASKKLAIVECGAGTVVPGLRKMSEGLIAEYPNATLIRINPRDANSNIKDERRVVSLPYGALNALDQIDALLGFLVVCK